MHSDGLGRFIEQNAVVAHAQAQQPFKLSGKRLDPDVATLGVAMQGFQNIHCNGLRDGADLGRYARLETDFFTLWLIPTAADLIHRKAAIGYDLLE